MEKFKILYQTSVWFIPLCIIVGLAYSYFLYSANKSWSKTTNRILFIIRFVSVAVICFLLTGPLIQLIKNHFEKPTIVLAIDNSESIKLTTDSSNLDKILTKSDQIVKELQNNNFEIEIITLNTETNLSSPLQTIYNQKFTDLNNILNNIESKYENRNLAATVLLSDGIFNSGIDPLYKQYSYPIYTIGMGDTIGNKDLILKKLNYNRIAYTGNKFPIVAEIQNVGFKNKSINIQISQGNEVLQNKNIELKGRSYIETEFIVSSKKPGLQHLLIEVKPLEGEFTTKNNAAHAYVEILDAKEKILLAAPGPHPDLKALKAAIETKENYQVDLFIPGMFPIQDGKYDLVIFHQIPDLRHITDKEFEGLLSKSNSHLYIIGNQSNISKLNQINNILTISGTNNQVDLTSIGNNPQFEKFKLEQEDVNVLAKSPPINTPFGNYKTQGGTEVILFQKIGSVLTDNPLLAVKTEGSKKSGILTGEGIWTWRMYENKNTGSTEVFDKFITSLVQYLSSKEDKRKLKLRPVQNEFTESEKVLFEAQLYNDIYEPVYNKKIQLKIQDEKGKTFSYAFSPNQENNQFEVKGLKSGLYNYSGSVEHGGRVYKESGEFLIKEILLEAINTTANHHLLRELSAKTQGSFYKTTELEMLRKRLQEIDNRPVIHSSEEFEEIIHLPWILGLLIFLLSLEWGIRKYAGHY